MTERLLKAALRFALLPIMFVGASSQTVSAQAPCQLVQPLNQVPVLQCAPTPAFFRDLQVIDTGQHKQTGTFLEVPRAKRVTTWPLGSAPIQACRFCLVPDRQNLKRLKSLE